MKYGKKDINHNPFIGELKSRGIPFWDVAQKNIGCDVIVFYQSITYFVEIKNGYSQSAQRLTENEEAFKDICDKALVPYLIIVDFQDFIDKII